MAADLRERRNLTVLFSDLSGFTRLSEGLDPEEIGELINALFLRLRATIERHGGTVDKFIGDAVMAVFGAPVAIGDEAARAIRAGLAMQAELRAFNAERSLALAMRIGINTGVAIWGAVGGKAGHTATGDAVNVAQRLESSARLGTVLVSRATERAARSAFASVPRGKITVKGREDPVEALEITGESSPAGRESALVGRGEELGRLEALLGSAEGGAVWLEGEPGVGKSRLLAELAGRARARPGLRVLFGRPPGDARLAFGHFASALRDEAGAASGASPSLEHVLASVDAALRESIPDPADRENTSHLLAISSGWPVPGARVSSMPADRVAEETRAAWVRWATSRLPAALILEDAHAADQATLDLLATLARTRIPILLLASARPGPRPPDGFHRLPLAELSPAEARAVAEARLGGPMADSFARSLVEATGGNPYYVEELARFLSEEKLVDGPPFALRAGDTPIPDSLHGVLTARIDGLSGPHRETLKCASVLGRAFWRTILSRLVERAVDDAVADARERGMVVASETCLLPGDDEFAFRHALLRDAAYALLTRRERQRLHAAAADLLEARTGEGEGVVLAIAARHREASGNPEAAARLFLQAARLAFSARAFEEALAAAREATRIADTHEPRLIAAEALVNLSRFAEAAADAKEAVGSAPQEGASRAWRVVASAARGVGDGAAAITAADRALAETRDREGRILSHLERVGALHTTGRHADALRAVNEAEAEAGDPSSLPPRLAAHLSHSKAARLYYSGDSRAAVAECASALARARAADDAAMEAETLNTLAHAHEGLGDRDSARQAHLQACEIQRRIGSRVGVARSLNGLALIDTWAGRFDDAIARFLEAEQIHRSLGQLHNVAMILGNLSSAYSNAGRFKEAVRAAEQCVAIRAAQGSPALIARSRSTLGAVFVRAGRSAEAVPHLEAAVRDLRAAGDQRMLVTTLNALGAALAALGRYEAARPVLLENRDLARSLQNPTSEAWAEQLLSQVALHAGTVPEALHHAELAVAIRRRTADAHQLGMACVALARARAAAGDSPGGLAALQEAAGSRGADSEAGQSARREVALFAGKYDEAARTIAEAGPGSSVLRAAFLALAGDPDAARVALEAASLPDADPVAACLARSSLALTRARSGDREARAAADLPADVPTPHRLLAALLEIHTLRALGDKAAASAALESALGVARRYGSPGWERLLAM